MAINVIYVKVIWNMKSLLWIFISILKNAIFTNVRQSLDKNIGQKILFKITTGIFCVNVLVLLLLLYWFVLKITLSLKAFAQVLTRFPKFLTAMQSPVAKVNLYSRSNFKSSSHLQF